MPKKNDEDFFKGMIGPAPTPEDRAERKAKYEADTNAFRAAELRAARGELVRQYRASPGKWPDGIDTKWDRWYVPEQWNDEGEFVGKKAPEA